MEIILYLAGVVASVFSMSVTFNWTLGPLLDKAAKNRKYPVQFSLADYLCLFVQVQLALGGLALASRAVPDEDKTSKFVAVVPVAIGLMVGAWWMGVRSLSRAGVHNTLGRTLMLAIGIPFGFVGSVAATLIAFAILSSVINQGENPPAFNRAGLLVLIECATVPLLVGLGFMTRRILAAAERQQETPSDDTKSPICITAPTLPPRSRT